jgi:hypothetical protein
MTLSIMTLGMMAHSTMKLSIMTLITMISRISVENVALGLI